MAILNVNGDIIDDNSAVVYDFFDVPYVSPSSVTETLNSLDDDEELIINIASGGGIVDAAQKMYTDIALAGKTHKVTCNITGMAASAATIIAMASPIINISPSGMMMIHKASCDFGNANADDLQQYINQLDQTDKSIVSLYQQRTGLDESTLLKMMSDTTFMNAQTCIQKGFADELMDLSSETEKTPVVTNSFNSFTNPKTLNRMKEVMNKLKQESEPPKEKKLNRIEDLKQTFGVF